MCILLITDCYPVVSKTEFATMTSITPAHAVHDFLGEDDDDEQEKVYNTYREKWNCNYEKKDSGVSGNQGDVTN